MTKAAVTSFGLQSLIKEGVRISLSDRERTLTTGKEIETEMRCIDRFFRFKKEYLPSELNKM